MRRARPRLCSSRSSSRSPVIVCALQSSSRARWRGAERLERSPLSLSRATKVRRKLLRDRYRCTHGERNALSRPQPTPSSRLARELEPLAPELLLLGALVAVGLSGVGGGGLVLVGRLGDRATLGTVTLPVVRGRATREGQGRGEGGGGGRRGPRVRSRPLGGSARRGRERGRTTRRRTRFPLCVGEREERVS